MRFKVESSSRITRFFRKIFAAKILIKINDLKYNFFSPSKLMFNFILSIIIFVWTIEEKIKKKEIKRIDDKEKL